MVSLDEMKSVLEAVFPEEFDLSEITMESDLKKDVGLNSIGLLYMAMVLVEKYGVSFSNDDFVKMNTVADVIAKIEGEA
ncbi:MAG: hypothetical protein IKJ55_05800 [Clostridia bacterium]|nr:hypothetical protein [Clostridia bacterium]